MGGELTKLKIISFSDEECTEPNKLMEFEVQVNPNQFNRNYSIHYVPNETPGNVGGSGQFEMVNPEKLDLEFILDGTGVVKNDLSMLGGVGGAFSAIFGADDLSTYVTDKVKELKDTLYFFQGTSHRTPFIKVVWGEDLLKGVMKNLDISYTLFNPDGSPLRAKINLTIMQHVALAEQEEVKDLSSPDMTHVRVINEGDRIDLMCQKIYNSPQYYLQVAKANGLTNFRKLKTAHSLRFPPVEKDN